MGHWMTTFKIFLVVLLLGSCGCGFISSKDLDGNMPIDIARQFVDAVQHADYSRAAEYWHPGDVENIEANWKMKFDEFCKSEIACESYTLEAGGRDGQVTLIYFVGIKDGKERRLSLFLEQRDRRWKLRMDRFFRGSL